MSALPAELRNTAQGERWVAEIDRSLDAARNALARRKTLVFAAATLWIAVLLSALWVILVRYTLLDLPQWPALVFPLAWLGLMVVVRRTRHIGVGESARYLDRALKLDERVATSIELVRSSPVSGLRQARLRVPGAMLEDTAFHLKTKRAMMPSGWAYRLRTWQVGAMGIGLALLLGALFLPTPLDRVRAERAELQRALNDQIARVEQLRADLIARPGLDDASKAQIEQELHHLTESLSAPKMDRSAALAAIADAQERLHALSPKSPNDFLGVLAAAKTVQNATLAAARNFEVEFTADIAWSPDDYPDLSDLGKAAEASRTLSAWVKNLNTAQLRALSSALERAQTQSIAENPPLAEYLRDSSLSVSVKDVEKSATDLKNVAKEFDAADKDWQLAGAVEKALADLDSGRQELASAGAQQLRKGQVGFRRPGAPSNNQPSPVSGTPSAGGDGAGEAGSPTDNGEHGVSKNGPSASGQQLGLNSPDFGSQGKGAGASGGDGQSSSGAGSNGGSTGSSQQGGDGSPGSTAGGGSGDDTGTFGGNVSGQVGGAGGAISQVQNPQGRGLSQDGRGATDSGSGEEIYIPPDVEPIDDGGRTGSDSTGSGGQASSGDPRQEGLEGRAGEGGEMTQSTSQRGTGVKAEIRTPYTEVYGEYAKQASQALEGVYIPADAKEYVKEYFTELGK